MIVVIVARVDDFIDDMKLYPNYLYYYYGVSVSNAHSLIIYSIHIPIIVLKYLSDRQYHPMVHNA